MSEFFNNITSISVLSEATKKVFEFEKLSRRNDNTVLNTFDFDIEIFEKVELLIKTKL